MSQANLWKVSAITVPTGANTSTVMGQLSARSFNPGIGSMIIKGDGSLSPRRISIMEQKPMFSFTTSALASFLTAVGGIYLPISSTCTMWMTKLAAGGDISPGATNGKLAFSAGLIVPRRLECRHGQFATISADVFAVAADGVTAPVAFTNSVSLPSITTNEGFTLAKTAINGVTQAGVQGLSLDFGYKELVVGSDGNVYPSFCAIEGYAPKLTLTTNDATALTGVGVSGLPQGGTASVFYLAATANGGQRIASGTAAHISISIASGLFKIASMSESDESADTLQVEATPVYNGTNGIIVIGNGVVIA